MIDVEKLYVQHILEIEEIKKEHDKLMIAKITKYEIAIIEIKNKIKRKTILTPDVKIKTDQLKRTKSVCPKSGCITKKRTTVKVIDNVQEVLDQIRFYKNFLKIF